jgi:hypothetical protein
MGEFTKKLLTDIEAVIELPARVYGEVYGSDEYWKRLEKELQYEAKELVDFIRDHRSRDSYGIHIQKKYICVCKFCGHEEPEDFRGIWDCCEDAIQAQNVDIQWK